MSNDVCNDLMVEIFARLPLKSIIRLRSLSKHWYSRIVSPEFVHAHRLRCAQNPQKVIIRNLSYCGKYKFKNIYMLLSGYQLPLDPRSMRTRVSGFEFPPPHRAAEVVGSCNGILCMVNTELILCNFSVRRKLIVPRHRCLDLSFMSHQVALGFGFDHMTDDYKIVAISYSKHFKKDTLIYSLKTDSWSAIPPPSNMSSSLRSKACFLNGILHWVVDGHLNGPSLHILTFNVSTHVFGRILFPGPWRIRQLTTINGCLATVSTEGNNTWLIRSMKEYKKVNSWFVVYKFQTKEDDIIRVVQPVTGGELLAYIEGSKDCNLQTPLLKLEIEKHVESLELLDKERATPCEETILSMTKESRRSLKNSLFIGIKSIWNYSSTF